MPSWTKEQLLAIEKEGCNIIVSAGAGSGKTAVLTERVIRKLKNGVDINRLLILTFTNAAAKEMKERIRKAIKKQELYDQLDKIDSSYITTFDSFALSIVKKYHYLLNLNQDIEIGNSLILKFKKEELLENIFNTYYAEKHSKFLNFIQKFTVRDDDKIKKTILTLYDKLDLKYDKEDYLKNYIKNYYQEDYIQKRIDEYLEIINKKINKIKENLEEIRLRSDGDYYHDLYESLEKILLAANYDEIKNNLDISMPRLKKGMEDIKTFKELITKTLNEIKKLAIYDNLLEIKDSIFKTKDDVEIIIEIIQKLDKSFQEFKTKNSLYDFLDISKLAIQIVSDSKDVREELKNYFSEILVDEYQDTSDIQELFISLISNHNVYMVGDIKQSIYRFRNANPNLFKEKYENYQQGLDGFKIDLVKNFRSREETLDNINYIFNYIMDLEIGGADYKASHQMVFGNLAYNENKPDQDYNFELYHYEHDDDRYTKDEIEAFITASDILDKVEKKYQVFDKNNGILRDITYDDFVILIDKSTSFELYKKIFEYKGIPLTILKDETISGSYDLYIIKNIFVLLKKVKEKIFDQAFKYAYLSIGRSYLFRLSDDYLYHTIQENKIKETKIYEIIENLLEDIDLLTPSLLMNKIIEEFHFYEKLTTVSNINESIIRLDYLTSLASNLSHLSYTYLDILDYLEKMIENNEEIKYSLNKEIKNSVKIMTIHKSKGLEYHICYYTGLSNRFNTEDVKQRFIFDNNLGIITPYIKNGISHTIYHTLYKDNYIKEDISERIRLFYVALTRAKEKMILITSLKEDIEEVEDMVSLDTRIKYTSFASILNSIKDKLEPFIKIINLNDFNLTKNYTVFKTTNIKDIIEDTNDTILVEELAYKDTLQEREHFSKVNHQIITKELKEKMEFGTYLHYLLEILDLKNKDVSYLPLKYQKYIKNFLNSDLLKDIDKANIYQEYEFIYQDNLVKKQGVIDLMLEYKDHIDIIDYKLKNIKDEAYQKQLIGYRDYIKTKKDKPIHIYLYSIIDSVYEQIN